MTSDNKLADPWWRLNNLYYIKVKDPQGGIDENGDDMSLVVKFKPNWAQQDLYENMHFRNVILKARQLGFTTFIQLFILDRCLFTDHQNAVIVAHRKTDAETFFNDKIKFAYDHLPNDLKLAIPRISDSKSVLELGNGSKVYVSTSGRSGTHQFIHVSELGPLHAKRPAAAKEVVSGTLNTASKNTITFIESTGDGPTGPLFEFSTKAEDFTQAVANGDAEFTHMDYKFHFYPWWKHPEYVLETPCDTAEFDEYFKELEQEEGIVLSPERKYWYVRKAAEQGEEMQQEYPSIPREAFEKTSEVIIYAKVLRKARRQRRITRIPIVRNAPVNTFWDLGHNDATAIWFHQHVDNRHHWIGYLEKRFEDLPYFYSRLVDYKEKNEIFYGKHYLPHDAESITLGSATVGSIRTQLGDMGLHDIIVVPKCEVLRDRHNAVRQQFDNYYFDNDACEEGIQGLFEYKWKYDAVNHTTRASTVDNYARNCADALGQHAQGWENPKQKYKKPAARSRGGWGM